MWAHGRFYWNELMTRDPDAAQRFYGEMFGWDFREMTTANGHGYWLAARDGQPIAGIMDMRGSEFADLDPHWFSYISVSDIDQSIEAMTKLGGQIHRSACDIDGVGRIAIIADPSGAVIGWITPEDGR